VSEARAPETAKGSPAGAAACGLTAASAWLPAVGAPGNFLGPSRP